MGSQFVMYLRTRRELVKNAYLGDPPPETLIPRSGGDQRISIFNKSPRDSTRGLIYGKLSPTEVSGKRRMYK